MSGRDLASRMRTRITLQQPDDIADNEGGVTRGWSDVATVWAQVTPTSGSESYKGMQLESAVTHVIRIRYLAGVSSDMRILLGAHPLSIRAVVNEDQRGDVMRIFAVED